LHWFAVKTIAEGDDVLLYLDKDRTYQIKVKAGDPVKRGQQIAQVGLFGKPEEHNYHLHFDISTNGLLGANPRHWPSNDLNSVLANYIDPKKFIENHRP
jgi:murein DD-endopeptidase MepM/ murein hydrolase activator NlpD